MTETGRRQPDWLGRIVGLGVFALGIILLVLVFTWTKGRFEQLLPPAGGEFDLSKQGARLGIDFLVTIAQLFLMGLVGAWIAGRGAQLYAAANAHTSGH